MTSNSYLIILLISCSLLTKAQENIDTLRLISDDSPPGYYHNGMHVRMASGSSLVFNPKVGKNTIYARNGNLHLKGNYVYDEDSSLVRDGKFQFFYEENNQIKAIFYYENGKRTGIWQYYYYSNGALAYEQDSKSLIRTYFSSDGKIIAEGLMGSLLPDAPDPRTVPYSRYMFDHTFLSNLDEKEHWKFYDENGNCSCEGIVSGSTKYGLWKYYDDYDANNRPTKIIKERYKRYTSSIYYDFLEACEWK